MIEAIGITIMIELLLIYRKISLEKFK